MFIIFLGQSTPRCHPVYYHLPECVNHPDGYGCKCGPGFIWNTHMCVGRYDIITNLSLHTHARTHTHTHILVYNSVCEYKYLRHSLSLSHSLIWGCLCTSMRTCIRSSIDVPMRSCIVLYRCVCVRLYVCTLKKLNWDIKK